MDLTNVLRGYFSKVVDGVSGMKVLVLDKETVRIIGTVLSQSEILEREMYLTEILENEHREKLDHLRAVCLVRPTKENLALLRRELRAPKYKEYHLFFTNTASDIVLQELAEADVQERTASVQELYGDFLALDVGLFVAPVEKNSPCLVPPTWQPGAAQAVEDRSIAALAAVVLSMKRKPLVRFQGNSEHCRRIAEGLFNLAYRQETELFDFGTRGADHPPVVLVVDRLDDPVTPLLSQWTYQAMLHELIGMEDNTVDLTPPNKAGKEEDKVIFSRYQDDFYANNVHADFGSLGEAVRTLMAELAKQTPQTSAAMNLEDMKKILEDFPQYRASKIMTVKHVECLNTMSTMISERDLMTQGSLEYAIACSQAAMQSHLQQVQDIVMGKRASDLDKLRLLMLLALRYEPEVMSHVSRLASSLEASAATPEGRMASRAIDMLMRMSSKDKRVGDLFRNRSVMGSLQSTFQNINTEWYRMHLPLAYHTVKDAIAGKLKPDSYPFAGGQAYGSLGSYVPPREIVLFVVGGCTYAESRALAQLAKEMPGSTFVLGGTTVLNSRKFVQDLLDAAQAVAS